MTNTIGFHPLSISGAFVLQPSEFQDERGGFFKLFDESLVTQRQFNTSLKEEFYTTSRKGVIRGLHYQINKPQAKLIWCFKGEVFDVLVDLRRKSPTFGKWVSLILSEENRKIVYIPRGVAHGFLALAEDSRMLYQADAPFSPKDERGIYYADATLSIPWPKIGCEYVLSAKDKKWPSFNECDKLD
jgi:dTDP-4-dehydrorhamnose 3,5-epimerase